MPAGKRASSTHGWWHKAIPDAGIDDIRLCTSLFGQMQIGRPVDFPAIQAGTMVNSSQCGQVKLKSVSEFVLV